MRGQSGTAVLTMATSDTKRRSKSQHCGGIGCTNSRQHHPNLSFFGFPKDHDRQATIGAIFEDDEKGNVRRKRVYGWLYGILRANHLSYNGKLEQCVSYFEKKVNNTGKSGFSLSGVKSKLFGNESPEQKEAKLKQLEEQIVVAEIELKKVQAESELFIEQAVRDIDRFQRQKTKDLQEIFTNYAVLQIKQCKKGIAIWTSAKDCFSKM